MQNEASNSADFSAFQIALRTVRGLYFKINPNANPRLDMQATPRIGIQINSIGICEVLLYLPVSAQSEDNTSPFSFQVALNNTLVTLET